jgi:DNA-binding GntR family transcriptional regulator
VLPGDTPKTPKLPSTLVEFACEYLEAEIVGGRFKPGERLIEQTIAHELNISRAPIREACRSLERDGVLEHYARRGYRVRALLPDQIVKLYAVMAELEALAVRAAVPRFQCTADDRLRELMGRLREAGAKRDHQVFFGAHLDLHRLVYEVADNPVLERMLSTLRKQLIVYRAALARARGGIAETLRYHGLISRAILARDAKRASHLSRRLVILSGARLARVVHRPG